MGIAFREEKGWLKTVISKLSPIHGVSQGVDLYIGEWNDKVNLSVVSMDNYPMVLGMEFLDHKYERFQFLAPTQYLSWTKGERAWCL